MNEFSRRSVLGAAAAALAAPALVAAQQAAAPAAKGQLSDESLGLLLKAMGLEAKLNEKRYDFAFKSTIADQDWELSMSAVMSQDLTSIWIMAWLDELPRSAADVPRTALLRLLSENDKMGQGKFFAYIASNRRFVLQRVIPNQSITTSAFRGALEDLGASVVHTHGFWSTANWSGSTTPEEPARGAPVRGSSPQPSVRPVSSQQGLRATAPK